MLSPTPSSTTPTKILGPAVTVEMVHASDTSAPSPDTHFADANAPGAVMYIRQPDGLLSACWGGLMSTRAKFLGAAGVIVDGRVRDVLEHREMGFPVSFAFPSFFPFRFGLYAGYSYGCGYGKSKLLSVSAERGNGSIWQTRRHQPFVLCANSVLL